MNPSARPNQNSGGFFVYTKGVIRGNGTIHSSLDILPTIYLKTNISIISGKGTSESPFQLSWD